MRIIIASPSKTGNIWVKFLLADIYGLKILDEVPGIPTESLKEIVDQGSFVESSIFHQHFRPTRSFFDIMDRLEAHIVTTIRHPYDVFVSLYFYIQRLSHLFPPGTHFYPLVGKPIDDPEIIRYLERGDDGFGMQVALALAWVESRRSILVRYEDLVADTRKTIREITRSIAPVSERAMRRAVEANRADRMRRKGDNLVYHVRKGTSGDWRNHLTTAHLEAINSIHGTQIARLGYDLHDGPTS